MAFPVATLPNWVQGLKSFQEHAVWNKAALDAVGSDIPVLVLARNKLERREMAIEIAIVTVITTFLSPLHAWAFNKLFRHAHGIPRYLTRISMGNLKTMDKFKQALEALPEQLAKSSKGKICFDSTGIMATDDLRRRLIKTKTSMWIADMVTQGVLNGSIGFIKTWFTQKQTGKNRFTGEMGVVSDDKLKTLYYQNEEKKAKAEQRTRLKNLGIVSSIAVVLPLTLGLLMRRALLGPSSAKAARNKVMDKLATWSKHFDNVDDIWLSLASIFGVATIYNIGLFTAARSKNERKEIVIRKVPMQTLFFFGDLLWMAIATRLFMKQAGQKAFTAIEKMIENAPVSQKRQMGIKGAQFFLASFLVNAAAVSGLILFNNWLTTRKVKADSAKLDAKTFLALFNKTPQGLQHKKVFMAFTQRNVSSHKPVTSIV